jgi:H+/Cl- antiporter ClcA
MAMASLLPETSADAGADEDITEPLVAQQRQQRLRPGPRRRLSASDGGVSPSFLLPVRMLLLRDEEEGTAATATTRCSVLFQTVGQGAVVALMCSLFQIVFLRNDNWWVTGGGTTPRQEHWMTILLVTTAGGFVVGYWLRDNSNAQQQQEQQQQQQHLVLNFSSLVSDAPFRTVIACGLSVACGAPVGPELAFWIIAQRVAATATGTTITAACRRAVAVSAVLGCLLPMSAALLLGPVLTMEWLTLARPRRGGETSRTPPRLLLHPVQQSLATLSSAFVTMLFQWIVSFLSTGSYVRDINDKDTVHYDGQLWGNLALSIPLGIVCGTVGSLVWLGQDVLTRLVTPYDSTAAAPTLAGLLYGMVLLYCPRAGGMGLDLVQQHNRTAMALSEDSEGSLPSSNHDWAEIAIFKTLLLTLCLGLGIPGGSLLPLAAIGVCIGHLFQSYSFWVDFAVPCCMLACPVSHLPAPVSAALLAVLVFHHQQDKVAGPIFVACITSSCISQMCLRNQPIETISDDERDGSDSEGSDALDSTATSEDELLRNVRTTIFGSQ